MHTVEYRMGRNVKGVPMSDERWAEFVAEAREYLEAAAEFYKVHTDVYGLRGIAWVETHYGRGEWDGVVEESAVVTLYTDADLTEFAGRLADSGRVGWAPTYEDIVSQGEYLAREFEQDAVGVVFGRSTLAEGR